MTPTPPTERELLARALFDLDRGGKRWSEQWAHYFGQRADHLIASGWVRWEVAKERCAKAQCEHCRAGHQFSSAGLHVMTSEFSNYQSLHGCYAGRIRALTPPKGTER